jgi:hypothetical protein
LGVSENSIEHFLFGHLESVLMRGLWLLKTLGALDFDPGRLTDAFEILANQFQKLKLLPQLFLLARKIVFGRLKFK